MTREPMTRNELIAKWLLYALGAAPVYIAETMFLNRLPVFGVIPVLLPLTAVAVGLWEGTYPGALFGLVVGIIADAAYPGTPGGMTLALAVLGFLAGAAAAYGVKQNFPGYLLCSVCAMGLLELFRLGGMLLTRLGPPMALLRVAALEAGWSLCFTPVIFLLFRAVYRRVSGEKAGE